jgi:hypothetical protein
LARTNSGNNIEIVDLEGKLNYQIETLHSGGRSTSGNQINIVGSIVVFLS